jgi:hypothetical protein
MKPQGFQAQNLVKKCMTPQLEVAHVQENSLELPFNI